MAQKLDTWDYDINKIISRLKKKKIKIVTVIPHPSLPGIPVCVNSKGMHTLPVKPENGLPPAPGPAATETSVADTGFSGSLGDFSGASMGDAGASGGAVGGNIGGGGMGESVTSTDKEKELDKKTFSELIGTENFLKKLWRYTYGRALKNFPNEDQRDLREEIVNNTVEFISKRIKNIIKSAEQKGIDLDSYIKGFITNKLKLEYAEEVGGTRHNTDNMRIVKFLQSAMNDETKATNAEALHELNKKYLYDCNNLDLIDKLFEEGYLGEDYFDLPTDEEKNNYLNKIKKKFPETINRFKSYWVPGNRLLSVSTIKNAMNSKQDVVSLDSTINNDGDDKEISLNDIVADSYADELEDKEKRDEMLENVVDVARQIFDDEAFNIFCDILGIVDSDPISYTGNNKSVNDIAEEYGFTRYHAKIIVANLLNEIKKHFKNYKD